MTDLLALEQAELEAFTDLYRAAGPDVVEAAGLSVAPVDGAMPSVPVFATLLRRSR